MSRRNWNTLSRTRECMIVLRNSPNMFMPGINHSWSIELKKLVAVGYVVMVKKTTMDNVEYEMPELTAEGFEVLNK